jgi:hypothetical protein
MNVEPRTVPWVLRSLQDRGLITKAPPGTAYVRSKTEDVYRVVACPFRPGQGFEGSIGPCASAGRAGARKLNNHFSGGNLLARHAPETSGIASKGATRRPGRGTRSGCVSFLRVFHRAGEQLACVLLTLAVL